ncbi:glycosyltransferase [Sphingomonas sp. LB-2]|uniref:glycosyltransferase n=1 Tax=Sphingomonas caeni TaxID=2984949 RepID=UPI00222EA137|nr:glycosyltransferase [Sphingomonas caeni]MCW3848496.1 glycosyltransferase [Sphingomonas caeni]
MTESNAVPAKRPRIAFVCTQSFALTTLYRGLFPHLRERGFDCEAVTGDSDYLGGDPDLEGVPVHVIPMVREPSPWRDLVSLIRLIGFFARHRYDAIHVSTVKAAFLASIAARLTGQSAILFVVRTRIYQGRTGLGRKLYEAVDGLVCRLSRYVAPIGREMGEAMAADGICPAPKLRYFGAGSSNGIDTARFSRSPQALAAGMAIRREAGVPDEAPLMLYVGRLAYDKGIHHLPAAMDLLAERSIPAWLMLVGPVDWREPVDPAILADLDARDGVVRLGFQSDPAPLYAAADLFLFPSAREGFGNVALEAQAAELPVVGFDTFGVREAVQDGVTGLLAPLGDTAAFAECTARLMADGALRRGMGQTASERVRTQFSNQRVWADLVDTLHDLAGSKRA